MGSTVSLAVGLALTWVVFLLLPEHAERLEPEKAPLARAIGLFTLLAVASAASFLGALRLTRWRFAAYLALVALVTLTVWVYRPAGAG
jgi:ABC-type antimicrobial peptide transport system permease subunit